MKFHLMFVRIIFSSVYVAKWSPIGERAAHLVDVCSLCIFTICNFRYFPFWF